MKKTVALLLAFEMLRYNAPALAGAPTIPGYFGKILPPASNTVPVYMSNPGGGATISQSGAQMTITQNQGNANVVIDWSSFNIGSASTVRFYQGTGTPGTSTWTPNTSYAALNRIYDANPSLIYGNLMADGKVYLINRNGILFGPGSQTNVYGLAASALNMNKQDFLNGLLSFTTASDTKADTNGDSNQSGPIGSDVTVANYGTITTGSGGFAALVGPQAVNGGTISSPSGKIALIGVADAGQSQTDVEFLPDAILSVIPYDIVYNSKATPGIALNTETGSLIADTGRVEMQGSQVTQNGLIRAVSTVKLGGEIYLLATDTVTTGPTSQTLAPVSDSTDKVSQTFSYDGGAITLGGVYTYSGTAWTSGANPSKQLLNNIVHNGDIEAPTGTVTLDAVNRIYLESGSSINVSGLWVNEPASANLVDAQLNSVQLADSYTQKNGVLLGQNITTTLQNGSSIGNISGSYTGTDETAQERSTTGGSIMIGSASFPLAEFIAKQGATLDFSGGGYNYAAGIAGTTKLVSGNSVYDISNAPQNLSYQSILNDQQFTNAKFGITSDYQGIYLGGGTPLNGYVPAHIVGSNAGSLSIQARQVVLDSTLSGSVTQGANQTLTTNNATDYATAVAQGLEEPVGGTLTIGNNPGNPSGSVLQQDFITNAIEIRPTTTPLPASFGPNAPLTSQQSVLSASLLNSAGLSYLNLFANTSITIDPGARISLAPCGTYTPEGGSQTYGFTAKARRIIDQGEIDAPGGSVSLTLQDNTTTWTTDSSNEANPLYISSSSLPSAILLDNGSKVNVAGQTADYTMAGNNPGGQGADFVHVNGGTITIADNTIQGTTNGDSVIVRNGAVLDVSGGYSINTSGTVTGGNAGTLTLAGATLSLGGDLRGFSLPGATGGTIILHAGEVVVAPQAADLPDNFSIDDPVPAQLLGKLTLGENRLASTGFAQIGLEAIHDVVFEGGTTLSPSVAKSATPVPGSTNTTLTNSVTPETVDGTSSPDYVGPTSVKVTAGTNIYTSSDITGATLAKDLNAQISIPYGAAIKVVPGGSIALTAPNIGMAGTLDALGGNVGITTVQNATTSGMSNLIIGSTGTILAGGYNKPGTATVAGLPAGPTPEPGGTVTLTASGDIDLEHGSLIDVSGSPAVQILTAAANGTPLPVMAAGNPGSLVLNFAGASSPSLSGVIVANPRLSGVQGGTVTVNDTNASSGLAVSAADIQLFQNSGFDAMTFRSPVSLDFQGSITATVARSLTLDTPLITGGPGNNINLSSPWLQLNNSSAYPTSTQSAAVTDTAKLTLSGGWVDVNGSVQLSGFSNVLVSAQQDIRLTDSNYTEGNPGTYNYFGNLNTDANLTLQAARIYPTTLTGTPANPFAISAGGTVTILPGATGNSAPIYSAGGNLAINAVQGIDVSSGSVLAAPMGTIALNATGPTGRVYLASGSLVTTSSGTVVDYGTYDGANWYGKVGSSDPLVTAAPAKSITINGNEVVVQSGAKLDVSGGGTAFAYLYQPDTQGTTNPISTVGISALTGLQTRPNRYVILPDNSVQIPGFTYTGANGTIQVAGAVYLNAMKLDNGTTLKAGYYSLLPEQYAFLPGALIISDTGTRVAQGSSLRTSDGYQIDAGYSTVLGTGITSNVFEGYEIQSAANVLKQGNFTTTTLTAGNAGNLTISGASTVLAGTINAAPLPGYTSGALSLSGSSITVQESVNTLPAGFDFNTPLSAALSGQLQLAAATLTNSGFGTLNLGNASTNQIDIKSGSVLNAPNITLSATNTITVEGGAQVTASSGGGTVSLSSPTGTVNIQSGAQVYAAGTIALNANYVNLDGSLSAAPHGTMNLASSEIYFEPDSYVKNGQPGLYLTDKLWESFADYDQVTLTSSSNLNFMTNVSITAGNTLTLDAAKFTNYGATSVVFNAGNINLRNSGSTIAPNQTTSTGGSLTLNAGNTLQATGQVAFDGFGAVNLSSLNDMTLMGAGSLATNGNLNLTAARVTTSYYRNASNTYNAADFAINVPSGDITINSSGGTAGTTQTPGGSLAITGNNITLNQSAFIEVPSGQVQMTANSGNITLDQGARIQARGSAQQTAGTATTGEESYSPGGEIYLSSTNGNINMASGSLLDVSAAAQGDAGAVSLAAPKGTVTLAGTLSGNSTAGAGGSFALDTNAPSLDLNALNGMLQSGGFTNQLNIRARQGDLTLAQGQTMTAQGVVLEADGTDGTGNIAINGAITALQDSSGNGGQVYLYAQNNLNINGTISANASTNPASSATGGYVYLNSESSSGIVTIAPSAVINVNGGPDSGTGGTVYLRAQQNTSGSNGAGVNIAMPGTINGASQVVAEAFVVEQENSVSGYTMNSTDMNSWLSAASKYINNVESSSNPNLPVGWNSQNPLYHLRPGIEIQNNTGDITLSSDLDLTSDRFGSTNEPGVLTLRAAENLNLSANLVDHPTAYDSLYSSNDKYNNIQNSWGFNLTAGADLAAANPLAVLKGLPSTTGNLTIATGELVYTEDAPINFASANNTSISTGVAPGYMITDADGSNNDDPISYSLAGYGGNIRGDVGNNLTFTNGGAIQTATGNITLAIGGNLELYDSANKVLGAIRTTGEYAQGTQVQQYPGAIVTTPAQINDYWTYENGGNIQLNVAGSVIGNVNTISTKTGTGLANSWDYFYGGGTPAQPQDYQLAASFQGANATQGIATMGGGDISVRTGGSFTCQIGDFGTLSAGNLDLVSGGNLTGRFRVMNGQANLISGGNFGAAADQQVLELANAQFSVSAQGDAYLGAALNPDINNQNLFKGNKNSIWNLTYDYSGDPAYTDSFNTSVSISSLTGNLNYYGVSNFDGYSGGDTSRIAFSTYQNILPPSVSLLAAGNINLFNNIDLSPSPTGNIQLFAGGSIVGQIPGSFFPQVYMYDQAPSGFYGYESKKNTPNLASGYNGDDAGTEETLVHTGDNNPVQIVAGQDIVDLSLYLTKEADIRAGRDIKQLVYVGENIAPTDVTSITAGRDIDYIYNTSSAQSLPILSSTDNYGIEQGGPGTLVVQAGRNIDLGNSGGIQSVGNFYSPQLSSTGCDVIVAAGAKDNQLHLADAQTFFSSIEQAGIDYSNLQAQGNTAAAQQVIVQERTNIISKLFGSPPLDGSGTLSMTQSQICTLSGNSNIYIMTSGDLNVGVSVLSNNQSLGATGIYTAGGGAVNIFSGGDVNVNESRMMTFEGGDIAVWSDQGSINAGRGSKTAVSAAAPHVVDNVLTFTPPATGSGIRATTYDPNSVPGGPLPIPAPGNIYLFAPQGVIDAGEAGISGGKVILGATQVLNAQNITFSSGSVGVPASSEAGISIGSLAGAGSVADSTKMIAQNSSLGGPKNTLNQQAGLVDQFMSNFLDVKVINFDTDEGSSDNGSQVEKERKKK